MSTQDTGSAFSFWDSPDGSTRVVYSLPLFNEIDFSVNEGYRMIPRGGVETAGLLFGSIDGDTIRVQHFRPIECQHAMGPSFILSEQDVEKLHQQLEDARADSELAGTQPVGWFIGHTRNPLKLNDAEVRWFEDFLPGSPRITVLVKPEHFQPTRFGFLVRRNGTLERDATQTAIILPMQGRPSEIDALPSPSIPAPFERKQDLEAVPAAPSVGEFVTRQPETPAFVEPEEFEASEPAFIRSQRNADSEDREVVDAEQVIDPPAYTPPELPAIAPLLPLPNESPIPERSSATLDEAPMAPKTGPVVPPQWAALPPRAPEATDTYRRGGIDAPLQSPRYETLAEPDRNAGLRFAAILLLSAILGCMAGYWGYLQLPAPVIPLTVREQGADLVVEWPAKQTDSVNDASLRVNDGPPFALSPEQRTSGRVQITPPGGNVKIELIAKHWFRDSHGIVRYIRSAARLYFPARLPTGAALERVSYLR